MSESLKQEEIASPEIKIDPAEKAYLRIGLSWEGTEKSYQDHFHGRFRILKAPFITAGYCLSWIFSNDANDKKTAEEIDKKIKEQGQVYREDLPDHDLDLLCFCYDTNGELINFIAPFAGQEINENVSIAHSGDDKDGVGVFDDEDTLVCLREIPENIECIFWAVDSERHDFSKVHGDSIRAVDTSIEQDYFRHDLADDAGELGADKITFIFASLRRQGSLWCLKEISEYVTIDADPGSALDDSIDEIIRTRYL
jgi:stress response protein SCP2